MTLDELGHYMRTSGVAVHINLEGDAFHVKLAWFHGSERCMCGAKDTSLVDALTKAWWMYRASQES